MKKIFLSLLVVFMVLSLSVVLVKAEGETSVALTDGVQIRTDGNNGLRWEAKVQNAQEGQVFGFLFAQGELTAEQLNKDTANVFVQEVEGLKEDGTYHATMINFPKSAAVQDITVRAYVKTGETYIYSENVVVRNLSEVAVEAYEKGTATGDFVKAVYDASETTLNLNGGELYFSSYSMSDYNHFYSANGVMLHGYGRCSSSGSAAWVGSYDRIFMKYDSELGAYRVVATNATGWTHAGYATQDYDLALMNSTGATDSKFVEKLAKLENVNDLIFKIESSVELNYATADKNIAANITIKVYENEKMFTAENSGKLHLGGGNPLPEAKKEYYEFAGWYNNAEFQNSSILNQGIDRILFAKYNPINYVINYSLNGGTCTVSLIEEYNIESETITLPTTAEMVIENGTFSGWYDNPAFEGSPVLEIKQGSHTNINLYALWTMNLPTILDLSSADTAVLNSQTPTIIVHPSVSAGKYIANGVEYVAGSTAFAKLSDAVSFAEEDSIIYVFAGSYSDSINITTKGLSIIGPNFDVDANTTRNTEAIITGVLTIGANNTTINGIKFSGSSAILLNKSSNVSILNIYSDSTGYGYVEGAGNRKGFIYGESATVTNFTLKNSYINIGGSVYCRTAIGSYGTFNGMTIENNTFTHSYAGATTTEAINAYNVTGKINIKNNNFAFPTSNFVIFLGSYYNACTEINIIDNNISGLTSTTAGISARRCPAGCVVNIVGNEIYGMTGNCIDFRYSKADSVANIMYNYFDEKTSYKITYPGESTVTYVDNYYAAAQTTATSDYGKITSKDDLDYAYGVFKGEILPEVSEHTSKFFTNGFTLGEGYTLSALPTSVDTTLNFHKGGYWEKTDEVYVNHPYVLFYETSSSLTGFNYAYKVGLNYDEELEMYYVNQVITNSNVALDSTNLLSQYFLIINTGSCVDGFTWAKTLVVGDYLSFSSDINAVSSTKGEGTELTAKVYSDYEKYFYSTSTKTTIELPVLEKFGYKFAGWYTSDDFSGDPITEYTYQSTEAECTFYAKWTECVLTANMVMNNGANSTTADHSLSADGLTLNYAYVYVSGTNSFVVFQVYVDGVKTNMADKWIASYSNTNVLASWSDWSSMAAIKGAGTCVVTLTYKADPSIKVSFTATLVDGSAA